MPYCTQCGAAVAAGDSFCTSCGEALDSDRPEMDPEPPAGESAGGGTPPPTAGTAAPEGTGGRAGAAMAGTGAGTGVVDLLGRGWAFLSANPAAFWLFGAAGLVQFVAGVLGFGTVLGAGGGGFLFSLLFQLAAAVLVAAGSGVVIFGIPATGAGDRFDFDDLVGRSLDRLPEAVGAGVVWALLVGLGLVLFVLPGLYLLLRFAFVGQAVYLEGRGPVDALKLSWARTAGQLGTLLGLLLAVAVPTVVLGMIPVLGAPIGTALVTPIGVAALTHRYVDTYG